MLCATSHHMLPQVSVDEAGAAGTSEPAEAPDSLSVSKAPSSDITMPGAVTKERYSEQEVCYWINADFRNRRKCRGS